ncbi:MAG TPA: DUF4837 family protein [Flavobacterium sp.]
MNKAHFFLLLLASIFFSCQEHRPKTLATASGKVNTISVIIDDDLWNGEIGDSIRNKFASPVIGLPQEEPLFDINQYPVKLLEGFMTNARNIIVVKKEPASKFRIVANEYAIPQNVVHISGRSVGEILAVLQKSAPTIIKLMKQTEIEETQKRIDTSLLNISSLKNKFNISLKIPTGYIYVLEKEKFTWLKKEIISGNTSLLIYEVPLNYLGKANVIDRIIKMRDSIGDLYIHGTIEGTRMITEAAYAPYLSNTKINGRSAVETKGTWEMKDDFMSGPFLNYAIRDSINNRILVLEGFCYAPSKQKRDLMHELEAVIRSLKISKNGN